MHVSGDTAFVDFVAVDKYPRIPGLTPCTIARRVAPGPENTVLIQEGKKYYIHRNEQCPELIFGRNPNFRMKSEEQFYGRKVPEIAR